LTPQEEAVFKKAGEKIKEQNELLKELTAPAYHVGCVVELLDKTVIIETNGQLFELERTDTALPVTVGQGVDVHPKTGQIVQLSKYVSYGNTGNVIAIDDNLIQINLPSGVVTTPHTMIPVAVGDKVVLNSTNHVILKKIKVDSRYLLKTQRILTWDDVGACADAKAELREALESPFLNKEIFEAFHKDRVKGALLWGRPGNGKTLLGRAAAGSMAKMFGKDAVETGFIYIKGPEILDKFVGETEGQIREPFAYGRQHFKVHGYPCILFIDEAEAILMRRGVRSASGMEMTTVPMFNAEMDGIEESGVFVILATNRADVLDPAIIRPGRIDRKIYVAPPTKENAPEIFNIHMRNVPLDKCVSKEQLITAANEAFFSDKFPLYYITTPACKKTFSLSNLASGAMIAGLVERATAVAIRRNDNPKNIRGLCQNDFDEALVAMQKEQYGMNHYDELREFIDTQKLEVTSIETCHDGSKIERPKPAQQAQQQVVAIPIPKDKASYDA
jgi:proteasome-associated ATPase